jgi:hypothetical protein
MSKRFDYARVLYTVPNITTGEDWACIEVFGGHPATMVTHLGVPVRQADIVVALINDAHRHLDAALKAYTADDPAWRGHVSRVACATDELKRMRGAPRKPRGRSAPELQAEYLARTGSLEKTARHFKVKEMTVLRNVERAAAKAVGQ